MSDFVSCRVGDMWIVVLDLVESWLTNEIDSRVRVVASDSECEGGGERRREGGTRSRQCTRP